MDSVAKGLDADRSGDLAKSVIENPQIVFDKVFCGFWLIWVIRDKEQPSM